LIALLALQPALNCSARLRQALVIAAGAKLRLINGVSVIAKFDGEHNAMPTPVAAQAILLAIATGSIVQASGPGPRLRIGRNSAHC
jgi:hypothetical protein